MIKMKSVTFNEIINYIENKKQSDFNVHVYIIKSDKSKEFVDKIVKNIVYASAVISDFNKHDRLPILKRCHEVAGLRTRPYILVVKSLKDITEFERRYYADMIIDPKKKKIYDYRMRIYNVMISKDGYDENLFRKKAIPRIVNMR